MVTLVCVQCDNGCVLVRARVCACRRVKGCGFTRFVRIMRILAGGARCGSRASYPPFPRAFSSALSPPLFSCHGDDVKLHHRFSPVDGRRGGATNPVQSSAGPTILCESQLLLLPSPPAQQRKKRRKRAKMREIVHLQAGQCGNQIGAKVKKKNPPLLLFSPLVFCDSFCRLFMLRPRREESPNPPP